MSKWHSNNADLLEETERLESFSGVAEEDESFSKSEGRSACSEHESKNIGLSRDKENDSLHFDLAQTMKSAPAVAWWPGARPPSHVRGWGRRRRPPF